MAEVGGRAIAFKAVPDGSESRLLAAVGGTPQPTTALVGALLAGLVARLVEPDSLTDLETVIVDGDLGDELLLELLGWLIDTYTNTPEPKSRAKRELTAEERDLANRLISQEKQAADLARYIARG